MLIDTPYRILFLYLIFSCFGNSQTVLPTDTSPEGFDMAPVGWTIILGSTDVSNKDYWGGTIPWYNPVINPPNGDTLWASGIFNEIVGTTVSDLTIGVDYVLDFYMVELSQTDLAEDEDGILKVEIGDDIFLYPFTGGPDNTWVFQTIEFTATAPTLLMSFEYDDYIAHTWNISFGSDLEIACDTLETYVSEVSVCFGEEVTLNATSSNDGLITWDGGITNDVPFVPPLGTTLYYATSDVDEDCDFGIEITASNYPEFELDVEPSAICEDEPLVFSVDGEADVFEWNIPDVEPDVPYFPDNGTYYVVLTGTNGVCTTVDSTEITVNPFPDVDALVEDANVCLGEPFVFYGEGADVYYWEDGIVDGEEYLLDSPGIDAYFVVGVDTTAGCEASDYVYATVHELPEVVATADETVVCEGELVTLTGSGATEYEWDLEVLDGIAFTPPVGTTTYTVIGTSSEGCQAEASIDITVYTSPEVSATASEIEICEGDEIILNGDGADIYEWDSGVTDGEPFVPEGVGAITYSLTGIDDAGCEGTTTIEIFVHPSPTVTALATPGEICDGESTVLTASGADVFTWEDGIIDGVAYTPGGIGEFEYTVTGTDTETGCANTADVTVVVHENPTVTANATLTELCLGESTILTGDGAAFYFWEDGVVDGASFTPASLGTHTYVVTGISDEGCENSAAITIDVLDCVPVHAGFEMPSEVCLNDCITITDTSLGNVVSWSWEFSAGIEPATASVQDPTICLNEPGTYAITLNVVAFNGAESTHTQDLLVNENPIIDASTDTIIDLGGTANLIGTTTSEGDYFWSPEKLVDCPDCQITTTSPEETQTYTLLFIDENGCKAEDQVLVMVNYRLSVGVPTAFSPNGDGNNDVLFVKGLALRSIYFTVYNRYGEQIFETTNQNIGWDGTFKNRVQNPGVFSWVLQYETLDGKSGKLKGNTTLIR